MYNFSDIVLKFRVMAKKTSENIIDDLQNNPDYVVLNNPLAVPKFIRKISRGKERTLSEVYTPKIFFEIVSRLTPMHLDTEGGRLREN